MKQNKTRYILRITLNNGVYYDIYVDDDNKDHETAAAFIDTFRGLIEQYHFINVNTLEGTLVLIFTKNVNSVELKEIETTKEVNKFIERLNVQLEQKRAIKENKVFQNKPETNSKVAIYNK